jgi:uncharacterized protein (UPF0335 family)
MSDVGHNSSDDRLRLFIERVEQLEKEKGEIAEDIKDVYAEVKAMGYDAKIVRQLVRLRKLAENDRKEQQMLLETYASAIGLDLI